MKGRAIAVAFILGTGWVQYWAQLWSGTVLLAVFTVAVALVWLRRFPAWWLAAFLLALVNANWQAAGLQKQQLPVDDENKAFRLQVQIQSLVRTSPDSRAFKAKVVQARPDRAPETILITWGSPEWGGPYAQPRSYDFPEMKPGQVWQLTSFLKTPHGARNPNSFDYEAYIFAQGIRAVGAVRGQPVLISDRPQQWSIALLAEMWRHHLRESMQKLMADKRWAGVILALSIGDQASIDPADWQVFNRTGLTHLVSISGTHVTVLAASSAVLFAWLWRRLCWGGRALSEYVPAVMAAGAVALVVAGLYSVIAGFGVPARRTFIMFAVTVITLWWRLPLVPTQGVAIAAVIVLLFDPWAVVSSGFWLSFGAIMVLIACDRWWGKPLWLGGRPRWQQWWQKWYMAAQWQVIISVALLPILAFLFFEMSLVSPLSNAYAIPIIGLLITPLALLFAVLSVVPWAAGLAQLVLGLCHGLLTLTMHITVWLSQHSLASLPAAKPPLWALCLAIGGMTVALWPRALPRAWLGWGLLVPALFWKDAPLAAGQWRLHALDVGQGSAVVVETASSVLVFDTGLRRRPDSDEGERTLVPYLHSLGHKKIDILVLSHADIDHVGGTRSVLAHFPVEQSYSSFDLSAYLAREARLLGDTAPAVNLPVVPSRCEQGRGWQVDGVHFQFVWPSRTIYNQGDKNAQSCVLEITGEHHNAIIMGDVGTTEEAQLIAAGVGAQDVVVVGHHGSRTSSGQQWVDHTQAQIAIAQVGWWSRYGHPHSEVVQRWQQAKTQFLRTDHHGAVVLHSQQHSLTQQVERQSTARYWQNNTGLRVH